MRKHKSIRQVMAAVTAFATVFSCCYAYGANTGTVGNSSVVSAAYGVRGEGTTDDNYQYAVYYDYDGVGSDYCIIQGYSGTDTELVIPSTVTYDGTEIPVTEIKQEAFRDNTAITSVTIPEGVTSIGQKAFSGCTSLTDVSFPKSLQEIGVDAFENCPVKDILISGDLTSGQYAFDSDSLETITFADGVTTIPEYTFRYMENLKAVHFSDTITEIGSCAFCGCKSLTDLVIPDSVKTIGDSAFEGCTGLESVVIGNGVETIGNRAFYGYSTEVLVNLKKVTFGNSIKTIGADAFANSGISGAITFPDTLETIGESAFGWCDNITSVQFGKGIKLIGKTSFISCDKLIEIGFTEGMSDTVIGERAFESDPILGKVVFPSGIVKIGENAFDGFWTTPQITAVELPDTLEEIGDCAFRSQPITRLVIPDSVTSIGVAAFAECSKLRTLKLSENLTSIPRNCFAKDFGLEGVIIPDSVKEIGTAAFQSCSLSNGLTLGSGLESVGASAFEYSSFPVLQFPDSVKEIGDSAFNENKDLTQIENFPKSLEMLGERAFGACSNLTEIPPIPAQIGEIPDSLFSGCEKLDNVVLEDGITQIGNSAFSECALTKIGIPDSVKTVLSGAFAYNDLTDITIGKGVAKLGSRVFAANPAMHITVPDNVSVIGAQAIGYGIDPRDPSGDLIPIEGFIMYGASQTVKDYSADYNIAYEEPSTPTPIVTTVTTTETTTETVTTTATTESTATTETTADTVTTEESGTTTSTGSVTSTTTTTTMEYFASEDELGKMAMEDYRQKTGTTPAKVETTTNADGTLSMQLYDEDGTVLDTYVIDPVTGKGTDSAGGEVNLPQTGYSNIYKVITGLAALMTLGGTAIILKTRKKHS